MAISESNNFSTFEVTFPTNDTESARTLHNLGKTLGWHVSQRATLPTDLDQSPVVNSQYISPADLSAISSDIWGTEIHGETATNFLHEIRREFHKPELRVHTSYSDVNNEVILQEHLGKWPGRHTFPLENNSGTFSFQTDKIEAILADVWPSTPYPFDVPTVIALGRLKRTEEYLNQDWVVEPGDINRIRLAHYSRTKGLDQHTSQGSVGKALDVINIAAGLLSKEAVNTETAQLEFIDYTKLRDCLKTAPFSHERKKEIIDTIIASLEQQITGDDRRMVPLRPVIVEGRGGWTSRSNARFPVFEKIACISLAHLFDGANFTAKRHEALKEYLKQFA